MKPSKIKLPKPVKPNSAADRTLNAKAERIIARLTTPIKPK